MRDVFAVWRNTRAIVLVALSAGVYAAVLIPFKAIPIIPSITEIRPANAIPPVVSLLFGPAAAWGCALGNLIGDFFGTVGPGSIFGFIGNFLLGYLPYRLWRTLSPQRGPTGALSQLPLYCLVTLVGSAACALVIAFGVDWLGVFPRAFEVLYPLITVNNAVMGLIIGPILLALLYPRAQRWGLLAEDVQEEEDLESGKLSAVGASICLAALIGAVGVLTTVSTPERAVADPLILDDVRAGAGLMSLLLLAGSALLAKAPRLGAASGEVSDWAGEDSGTAVRFEGLTYRYRTGERPALDGLTLEVEAGTFVVLMGATGAGKSTLCRATNGLVPHFYAGDFSGSVTVFGRDVSGTPVPEHAGRIGLVFQDFDAQLISSDVQLEVAFAMENLGVPQDEMETRVAEALESVGLEGFERRDPATLSGGEKQRLALGSVLAARPSVLVLDEPTTDLDPVGKAEVFGTAREMARRGLTVIMAEHEADRALAADRVIALADGAVAYDGEAAGLLAAPEQCLTLGILPADIPACFAAVGIDERPTTIEAGVDLGRRLGLAPDKEALKALGEAELERQDGYGETIISVEGLTHEYTPGEEAVSGASLEIRRGEFVAILGQNGSGKTTLAKHLNGLLEPTSGTVEVSGGDATADLARTVGYVFQDPDHQIFCATVQDEVAFGPRQLGLEEEAVAQRVGEAVEAVGLTALADADPFTLTKGERQAVAVASALACDPQVLILDEPTTGLDGPLQEKMMELLRGLNARGRTIIIITHSMWAAAAYAHRSILMVEGRVIADGPTREVFANRQALDQASLQSTGAVELSQACFGVTLLSAEEFGRVVRAGDRERGQ